MESYLGVAREEGISDEEIGAVAVIERKLFGGTCVNTGCIPTKTLVASARAAYMARRAADFGVMIDGTVTVDMKKVKARKDDIAGRSNHEIPDWMKKISNLTVFKGHAYSSHSVRADTDHARRSQTVAITHRHSLSFYFKMKISQVFESS